ncbi:hypothetical protein V8V75_21715, partial [Peribacillus frigoritolerans]|uniref:hypothetical protein n=1 Tax=Peribacillus frigoritolerans TaxID=450367 RepID=UPI00300A84BD
LSKISGNVKRRLSFYYFSIRKASGPDTCGLTIDVPVKAAEIYQISGILIVRLAQLYPLFYWTY